MKSIKIMIVSCLLLSLAACNDKFLDREPLNVLSEPIVWSDPASIKMAANQFYNFLPTGFTAGYLPSSYTDDIQLIAAEERNIVGYTTGDFFNSTFPKRKLWVDSYIRIREVNTYLEKAQHSSVLSESDKGIVLGQAHFFRAFLYYQLFNAFQSVPLLTHAQTIEEATFKPEKVSLDEGISFIKAELEKASELLPENYEANGYGKVTKQMADAFRSRVLLWYASELNNPSGEKARWEDAAAAAKKVIDSRKFALLSNYADVFRKKNIVVQPEVILEHRYNGNKGEKMHSFDKNNVPYGYGGKGNNAPTQDLIDAYEMNNGLSIHSPLSGYDEEDPYKNRDPRLGYSVLHNGAQFKGRAVETFINGRDMPASNPSPTGYYIRKFIEEDFDFNKDPSKGSSTNWIIMRYAEVLLNYAEAKNEASGPDQSILDAINLIRERVKMPKLELNLSQSELRERIRNERRVELAFEDEIRYEDLRRWKIADVNLNRFVRGMKIEKTLGGEFIYTIKENVGNRKFQDRNYWLPYNLEDLRINPNLNPQNAGW